MEYLRSFKVPPHKIVINYNCTWTPLAETLNHVISGSVLSGLTVVSDPDLRSCHEGITGQLGPWMGLGCSPSSDSRGGC